MITWLVPRQDLTLDQRRAVVMPPTLNRIVMGFAGSGKTQILIHRADHIARTCRIPPDRFRVFVFTNVVKQYIRSGFEFLEIPDETVSTFDMWCVTLYRSHIARSLPYLNGGFQPDFDLIRRTVLDLVGRKTSFRNSLEFVLVDEGQDLPPVVYDILRIVARHVTVFIDPQQRIFDDGADPSFIREKLGIEAPQVSLLGAYRNASYVADLAAHFIDDLLKRSQYLAQVGAEQRVRDRPLFFTAASTEQEMDRLAEIVRHRQVQNDRIGIIVARNHLLNSVAGALAERGVEVERAVSKNKDRAARGPCDFGNLVPKIATFHQAKGLTFDSVLLPRLTAAALAKFSLDTRRRLLFTGIARAAQWVYLSTVEGEEVAELAALDDAAAQGQLTVQRAEDWRGGVGVRRLVKKRRGREEDDGTGLLFGVGEEEGGVEVEDDGYTVL
ncbi:MAG: AAA family ATPase [Acidobacteriota bacterium]|nr:AAA family ATPase [Acidobacteriota bacterium]